MKALIIFNTKYRKVRIQREFKNKGHVENYISLMHRKYSWFVDELYFTSESDANKYLIS